MPLDMVEMAGEVVPGSQVDRKATKRVCAGGKDTEGVEDGLDSADMEEDRPGVNPPSTIPNPIPVDFFISNPIPVNLAMIPIPIPVIFPSAIPTPNPIPISSY